MYRNDSLSSDALIQAKVDAICVRALFARARKGAMLAPLAMLFIGWMEKDVVSTPILVAWMIVNAIAGLFNFLLTSHLLKHPPPDERMAYWHQWEFVIRLSQGVIWGSAAILFHVESPNSLGNDLSVLVVLVSVSAVTLVNIASSTRILAGFCVGILLIPAAYYFWIGGTTHTMFGFGLILLLLVELETGREAYRQFAGGVRWGVLNKETSMQLEIRNRELDELNQQLSTIAIHDKLTGLYNRHFIVEQLAMQHDLFLRYGTACSLVLLDLDHFKQVNDMHGHAAGDSTLVAFSRCVEKELRHGDIFARYGGEEFLLVLPSIDLDAALQLANRIRVKIASAPLVEQPMLLTVTASFGVAQLRIDESVEQWLNRADKALYRAKGSGRNCVMT